MNLLMFKIKCISVVACSQQMFFMYTVNLVFCKSNVCNYIQYLRLRGTNAKYGSNVVFMTCSEEVAKLQLTS